MFADDGFAGAGGWDLAAQALGITARGIENMPQARATRDVAGLVTIHDDVWTFRPDGKAVGKIDSPPCQTFSPAGKGSGRKAFEDVLRGIRDNYYTDIDHLRFLGLEVGDELTALVLTPLHFATQYEYEWLAWEQVPTVLPVWEACAVVLRERGWHVWTGLLHAEQYGVPQTRKRAFLLASRRGPVSPPTPTHSRYYSRTPDKLDAGVAKWVSMAEALGWEPEGYMRSNYGTGGDSSKRGERLLSEPAPTITSKIDRNRVEWAMGTTNVRDGEYQSRGLDHPAPTITAAARSFRWGVPPLMVETPGVKGGNMQENRVTLCASLSGIAGPAHHPITHPAATVTGAGNHETHLPDWCFNRPSTTIAGTFRPDVVAAPGYRTTVSRQNAPDSVRVTVAEAGVLQSFPADYPWQGAQGKQYLQVGNAVPPGLAIHALAAAAGIDAREAAA